MADDSATAAAQGVAGLFSLIGYLFGVYITYGYTNGMDLTLAERAVAIGAGAVGGAAIVNAVVLAIIAALAGVVLLLWAVAGLLAKTY